MTRFAIGLGSNEGDRLSHLRFALERLESQFDVAAISSLYETEPVGGPEQGPYLNAVAIIDAEMEPDALLGALHEVEADAGRERIEHWGPRTLDLDIVATTGPALDTPELVIPHPRASEREFVLRPLAEIWPDADVGGARAGEAVLEVGSQGVDRLRRRWKDDSDTWFGALLVFVQLAWFGAIAVAFVVDGSLPGSGVGLTRIVGGVVALAGLLLAVWASRILGAALTAVPEPLAGSSLVETGPYALARHPIYGGVVLFLIGASLFVDSVVGLAMSVGLTLFFLFKSVYEERRLRVRYSGYQAYRARVRKRLVPYLL